MDATRHFDAVQTFIGSWEDYFAFVVLIVMALLAAAMFAEVGKHQPNLHSPRFAWIRGGLYFCFAFVLSWIAGVLSTAVHSPLATQAELQDPDWIAFTVLCVAIAI